MTMTTRRAAQKNMYKIKVSRKSSTKWWVEEMVKKKKKNGMKYSVFLLYIPYIKIDDKHIRGNPGHIRGVTRKKLRESKFTFHEGEFPFPKNLFYAFPNVDAL